MATSATADGVAAGVPLPSASALTPRERAVAAAGLYVPDRCGGCGAVPDPPLRCAGCCALVYCSPGCQKADWREHKICCERTRITTHDRSMEDAGTAPARTPFPYTDGHLALLAHISTPVQKSARGVVPAQLVGLMVKAINNLDAPVVAKVLPFAAAAGVGPTTVSTHPPYTLLGLAAGNCTHRLPPEQLAHAFAIFKLLVSATPAAALGNARSFRDMDSTMTLLEVACAQFNRALRDDAVAALLQAGAGATLCAGGVASGCESLHAAAIYGTATTVRLLLEAGAPPDARSDLFGAVGSTPLHTVAARECPDAPEKVRLLVAAGADIEALEARGLTPLALAVLAGAPRAAGALLHLGANMNAVMTQVSISGTGDANHRGCVLHAATHRNTTATLRLLLAPEYRPLVDIEARTSYQGPHSAHALGGLTLLHVAARNGAVGSAAKGWKGALELLLDAGADVHAEDTVGATPVWHAVSQLHPAAVRLLLRAGAVRDEDELASLRDHARAVQALMVAARVTGETHLPVYERPKRQLVDDAARTLELLEAARAPTAEAL
jgi:ankyrin repeat protein